MLASIAVAAATMFVVAPAASAGNASDLGVAVSSTASGAVLVGDTFAYEVTITNHGSADATGVVMEDDLPVGVEPTSSLPVIAGGACSLASSQQTGQAPHASARCTLAVLAAGASVSVTIAVHVTKDVDCGTVTNTPAVSARNEPSSATDDDTASVSDTVTCPPSLAIAVRGPAYAHVGDVAPLQVVVTNDGSAGLDRVRVATAACSGRIALVDDGDGDAILGAGESWRYGCHARITLATGARLAARAVASAASGDTHVRATARTTVRVLRPALSVRVTPEPVSGSPGETIVYRYVVRNTGDATISDIRITDDRLGRVGDVPQLAPGHAATFTLDRLLRVDRVWVVDEVRAVGSDPSGRTVTATDDASVTIVAPASTTGPEPGTGHGGTAFTGSDATIPAALAIGLALCGGMALLLARRPRT
jgi:uncharacterized repeat protein (TIGR01451 family)